MAVQHNISYFQNDGGHKIIHIGVREFMCIGANPPFDHPHIFLDMGAEDEIICPYCSTLYRHECQLVTHSRPEGCFYHPPRTA